MFDIRALSGQEYVDTYATKRDNALVVSEKVNLDVHAGEQPARDGALTSGAPSHNGHAAVAAAGA
jgi:hypothetical protein